MEHFYDVIADLEQCEKDYKALDEKRIEIDKKAQEEKDKRLARQTEENDKKDAPIRSQVNKAETDLKEATKKQKDFEGKLAELNEKKADCEGKLGSMDANIKMARECCENERVGRDKAAEEFNVVNAQLNQVVALNNNYKSSVQNQELSLNNKKTELDTCNTNKKNSENELEALKAKVAAKAR